MFYRCFNDNDYVDFNRIVEFFKKNFHLNFKQE